MTLQSKTRALAASAMLALTLLAMPAFAADGDGMQSFSTEVKKMANKDGMVTKKDFISMMEKRFDVMDTRKKGMLSTAEVMRIFSDRTGQ